MFNVDFQSYYFSSDVYAYSGQTDYDTSGPSVMSLDLYTDTDDVISVNNLDDADLFEISIATAVGFK